MTNYPPNDQPDTQHSDHSLNMLCDDSPQPDNLQDQLISIKTTPPIINLQTNQSQANNTPPIKQQIQQQRYIHTQNQISTIKNNLQFLTNHQQHINNKEQHLSSVFNRLENIINEIQEQTQIHYKAKHKSNRSLSINKVLEVKLQKQIDHIKLDQQIYNLQNYDNRNLITQIDEDYKDLPKQLAQKPFLRTMTNPNHIKPTAKFIKITLQNNHNSSRHLRQLSNQKSQRSNSNHKGIKVVSSLQKNFIHNTSKDNKLYITQQVDDNPIANKPKTKTIVFKKNIKKQNETKNYKIRNPSVFFNQKRITKQIL